VTLHRVRLALVAAVVVAGVAASACSGGGSAPPRASSAAAATAPPTTSASAPPAAPSTSTSVAVASSGCGTTTNKGLSSQRFTFEGVQRTFVRYVPPSYDGTRPVPVVFEFHGYGSSALVQVFYGNFMSLANRYGFVIVAPNGQGSDRHFNLTGEPGLQDDVAMIGALLDHVEATMCVDQTRVYATGMSDGGAVTSALACHDPDRFAAFGAVAVVVYQSGCAATPVPIMAFAGTADPVVPFNGGVVNCCGNPTLAGAPSAIAGWAQHDGCAATPVVDPLASEVQRRTYTGCRGGAAVVFYVIEGGGHTWPGSIPEPSLGLTTHQIDATTTMWSFLRSYSLA
jgi:polyhydroxybutyrate depolymerase